MKLRLSTWACLFNIVTKISNFETFTAIWNIGVSTLLLGDICLSMSQVPNFQRIQFWSAETFKSRLSITSKNPDSKRWMVMTNVISYKISKNTILTCWHLQNKVEHQFRNSHIKLNGSDQCLKLQIIKVFNLELVRLSNQGWALLLEIHIYNFEWLWPTYQGQISEVLFNMLVDTSSQNHRVKHLTFLYNKGYKCSFNYNTSLVNAATLCVLTSSIPI